MSSSLGRAFVTGGISLVLQALVVAVEMAGREPSSWGLKLLAGGILSPLPWRRCAEVPSHSQPYGASWLDESARVRRSLRV